MQLVCCLWAVVLQTLLCLEEKMQKNEWKCEYIDNRNSELRDRFSTTDPSL